MIQRKKLERKESKLSKQIVKRLTEVFHRKDGKYIFWLIQLASSNSENYVRKYDL